MARCEAMTWPRHSPPLSTGVAPSPHRLLRLLLLLRAKGRLHAHLPVGLLVELLLVVLLAHGVALHSHLLSGHLAVVTKLPPHACHAGVGHALLLKLALHATLLRKVLLLAGLLLLGVALLLGIALLLP